jgi:Nif-specific regulatory protein
MTDTPTLELDLDDVVQDFTHCFTGECRVNVLPILHKISHVGSRQADLSALLAIVLEVMQQPLKMQRGMVMLYDRHSGTISIHDSFGLTEAEQGRGVYSPGEGITGKVVETGKAIVVPRLHENPDFLDRTGAHAERGSANASFICVPIMRADKVLGALCAERVYMSRRLLEQDVKLLATIGAMIAPVVELYLLEHIDTVRLETENRRLRNVLKRRFKPSNIIGNSKPMQQVYEHIRKVAGARATVLILGESGVGKELVASAIHYNSPFVEGPLVKSNCAAFPDNLVESELFGHEKGSFTGAIATHAGCFEQADGGTIFLDEVGELSLANQAKLLRVLQERTFKRVGGVKPVSVDLRIITATNRNLAQMVEEGTFREDLYYRLNVFCLPTPSLRERGSDVITLADHFVSHYGAENGKNVKRISTPALNMLMSYHWPGNVRELENVIERAVILSDDGVIHAYDLPPSLQTPRETGTGTALTLDAKLGAVEYEMIVEALKTHQGNVGEAAKALGLTRRMLGLRMQRHAISYKPFRQHSAPTAD